MPQPWTEPVTSVVFHGAQFGCHSQRIRNTPRRPLVVGREANADVAIVEDRIVWTVGLLDLIERLGDQEALQPITRHERQCGLEEVEPAQSGKFVQHQQQPMPTLLSIEIFRQATADLIEDQAYQWLGPTDIGRRHDQIQRGRSLGFDQIADSPIATSRYQRYDRISIKTEER